MPGTKPNPTPSTSRKAGWAASGASASGTHPLWIILLSSVWMAALGNLALWQEMVQIPGYLNSRGLLLGLGFGGLITTATMGVLSLLSWRWIFKPVVFLFLTVTAVSTFFMLTYHVVIDTPMWVNVRQADVKELRELLSWQLLVAVALLAVLPAWWLLRRPVQHLPPMGQAAFNALCFVLSGLIAAVILWAMYPEFSALMRSRTDLRYMVNPLNSVYALGDLLIKPSTRENATVQRIGIDAAQGPSYKTQSKPPLLLLVIGETARADNFSLNGYPRVTNPRLAKEDVVSYRQVRSCGTSTASSLPCMFSHLGHETFEVRTKNFQNLLDVLQTAGLAVLWVDNQSGCKGLCERVHQVDTTHLTVEGLCSDGECVDEVMLLTLEDRIRALPIAQRANGVVVVLHPMGSHGPNYSKRSQQAFKLFTPECTNSLLQDCAKDKVVNAYDNSIVYTDHVLTESLQWLRRQANDYSTSMIYVSDHGESLGEGNLYLHGLPYALAPDTQKHVPLITWLSPQQQQRSHVTQACLRGHIQDPLTHDNLFHSVLGLLDVQTELYHRDLDWFATCQK